MTVATLSADGRRLSAAVWARWEEEQERRDGDSLAGTLLALYGYDLADLVGALEAGQVDKARTLTRDLHDDCDSNCDSRKAGRMPVDHATRERLAARIADAIAPEVVALRDALAFYADAAGCPAPGDTVSRVMSDRGERARQALKGD